MHRFRSQFLATLAVTLLCAGLVADARTEPPGPSTVPTRYLEPERPSRTLQAILEGGTSLPWGQFEGSLNLGYLDEPVWISVDLRGMDEQIAMLEIAYPNLDAIDAHYVRNNVVLSTVRTGDKSPFSERPWPHRNFIFPIDDEADTLYLRVQTTTSMQVPLQFWTANAFSQNDQASLLRQGIFLGVLIVMALYNLFIFVGTRENSFILYVGYVFSIALYQAFHHGLTYQFLWPDAAGWHNISGGLFISAAVLFVSLFSREILVLKTTSPVLNQYLKMAAIAASALFAMSFAFSYSIIARLVIVLAIPTALLVISAGIILWYRGMRPAKFFTLGWTAFLLGTIVFGLNKLGLLPHTVLTENALQVGATVEVLLLSVALAERVNEERRERRKVQARLLREQRELTEAYARFVPAEFMQLMGKRKITDVELGDNREMEMTILFSDVRSFTSIAEGLTPKETFVLLNEYLGRMAPIIAKHGGFVDKYLGDGIMALFPADSDSAIAASAEMLDSLMKWNEERERDRLFPIEIGIGLNSGKMMLGTIGAAGRMEGTVISDCVNTASRIESLNKLYGSCVLLTETTFKSIPDSHRFNFRLLDRVRVKGKNEPVMIYELLDALSPEERDNRLKTRDIFHDALYAYWNAEFERALRGFQKCAELAPQAKAIHLLNERASWQARSGASTQDWTGAFDVNLLLQDPSTPKKNS